MLAKKIYPNCPACKGVGEYLLAGKWWPCTWCNIEHERETCTHEMKFDSQIPFVERKFHFCFRARTITDFELCIKCGKIGKIIRDE